MSPSSARDGVDDDVDNVGAAGDWVCCCTEGLEEVTVEEIAQLGGTCRVIGEGVVLIEAGSMPTDAVMRVRSVETCSMLVGTLRLTGKASPDLDVFKLLCHPSAGAWGTSAPSRWNAAVDAWVRARRAAVLRHGLGLGDLDDEGPPPAENMTWNAVDDDVVYVREEDGRLFPRGYENMRDLDQARERARATATVTVNERGAGGADESESSSSETIVAFRVSCNRGPGAEALKHEYKSIDVNHELGWSLGSTHPCTWRVDLIRPTLVVEVVIKGTFAFVALQSAASADSRRMRRCGETATTRPHLAAAMVRLAKPALGEVVVDIGCGMGTIMSEAAQHNCHHHHDQRHRGGEEEEEGGTGGGGGGGGVRVVLGGDVEFESAAIAVENLAEAVPTACFDVCAWSMAHLPLRTASQAPYAEDIITCDLPFGKAHLDAKIISKLYPAALRQVSRVLRVGGRGVLMGMRKTFNNILLHGNLPLDITYQRLIDKGGLKVALYVLERVDDAEWARREEKRTAFDIVTPNKRSEEHVARSKARAAARLARGETVGPPLKMKQSK